MKAQDFVIGHLKSMVNKFPYIKCTYQYDMFDSLHSIEILPKYYLNNPKELSDIQYNITKEFMQNFPYESLCFFTEGDFIEVEDENIVFCVKGDLFRQYDSAFVELFTVDSIFVDIENVLTDKGEDNFALAA